MVTFAARGALPASTARTGPSCIEVLHGAILRKEHLALMLELSATSRPMSPGFQP